MLWLAKLWAAKLRIGRNLSRFSMGLLVFLVAVSGLPSTTCSPLSVSTLWAEPGKSLEDSAKSQAESTKEAKPVGKKGAAESNSQSEASQPGASDKSKTRSKKSSKSKATKSRSPKPKSSKKKSRKSTSAKSTTLKSKGSNPRLPRYYSRLELDEKQKAKIHGIQQKFRSESEKLQKQMAKLEARQQRDLQRVLKPAQKKQLEALGGQTKASRQPSEETS